MTNQDVIAAYRDGRSWALGEPVSLDEWAAVMRAGLPPPYTYNGFDAATVRTALASFANAITLQPAREYSVAVYIRGERSALLAIVRMAKVILDADEIDFCERAPMVDGKPGDTRSTPDVLRLWWD